MLRITHTSQLIISSLRTIKDNASLGCHQGPNPQQQLFNVAGWFQADACHLATENTGVNSSNMPCAITGTAPSSSNRCQGIRRHNPVELAERLIVEHSLALLQPAPLRHKAQVIAAQMDSRTLAVLGCFADKESRESIARIVVIFIVIPIAILGGYHPSQSLQFNTNARTFIRCAPLTPRTSWRSSSTYSRLRGAFSYP